VFRCVVDVRLVDQRGDAGINRFQRAHQVRDVNVLGSILDDNVVEHTGEVLVQCATGEHATHRRLPRVPMGVHKAGHDDAIARINDVGMRASRQAGLHSSDLVAVDQQVR